MQGFLQEGDLFSEMMSKSVFPDTTLVQTWEISFRFPQI